MIRRPPRSTRTDTLFPYTTLFRSRLPDCRYADPPLPIWSVRAESAASMERSPVASNLPVLLSCSLIDAESAPPDCNVPLLVTLAALRVTRPGPSDPISVPLLMRSEERRVGQGCVSTCRIRWSAYH